MGARFSAPVQTGPGAHTASCTLGTRSFSRVKSGRGVTLTPHPLLVPWSRRSRAIPLTPIWAVRPVQSLSACTMVHFTFTLLTHFVKMRFLDDYIVGLKTHLLSKCCIHKKFLSFYFHKNTNTLTCWFIKGLSSLFSLSCRIVCWWVITNCSFMSDMHTRCFYCLTHIAEL
jgi:hypothetical protein